jgi:hypothetical protein
MTSASRSSAARPRSTVSTSQSLTAKLSYRLDIPRMFAALLLLSVAGIAIFIILSALRRWNESAVARDR